MLSSVKVHIRAKWNQIKKGSWILKPPLFEGFDLELLSDFLIQKPKTSVLILGDLGLDEYLFGEARRISP